MRSTQYTLLEQISAQDQYKIYRAQHNEQQIPVLITMMQIDQSNISQFARFSNQHHILKNLQSPFIVRSYDLFWQDDYLVWVSEYIEYSTLREVLTQHTLNYVQIIKITLSVLDAIEYLHEQHIIHQNITPDTIYIHYDQHSITLAHFENALRVPPELYCPLVLKHPERESFYLSPEHTHQLSPKLSSYSDLYLLGITLYEMLTGILPFQASNRFELARQHLTSKVLAANTIEPSIPPMLSQILEKMLHTQNTKRYHSAAALRQDLLHCLAQLQNQPQPSDQLVPTPMPDTSYLQIGLYGRESVLAQLQEQILQVSQGQGKIVMLSGPWGIGKTTVAYETFNEVIQKQGFFAIGRCHYLQAYRPYEAMLQIVEQLLTQLLDRDSATLQNWKEQISDALSVYPTLILQHLPILQQFLITTPQPDFQLSLNQQKHHLLLSIQRLLLLFAQPQHPLVLLIENMQWIDHDHLHLIQQLYTVHNSDYLLLLGTYRLQENDTLYPLALLEDIFTQDLIPYQHIKLTPLNYNDLQGLLKEVLVLSNRQHTKLAQWLSMHTQGLPETIEHSIKMLYSEQILKYDSNTNTWDLNEAALDQITDVITIDATILRRYNVLPPSTQRLLNYAACSGHRIHIQILAAVLNQDLITTAEQLIPAIQIGLIKPKHTDFLLLQNFNHTLHSYLNTVHHNTIQHNPVKIPLTNLHYDCEFVSDRTRQVLYQQLSSQQQQHIHLSIAHLLYTADIQNTKSFFVFKMVDHFNQSLPLLPDIIEQSELCRLNLIAGQKALIMNTFILAEHYFATAYQLLPENSWNDQYELTNKIYQQYSMITASNGNHEQAELLRLLHMPHLKNTYEQAEVHIGQIKTYIAQKNYHQAFQVGVYALSLFGIVIPRSESKAQILLQQIPTISYPAAQNLLTAPETNNHDTSLIIQILLLLISMSFNLPATIISVLILVSMRTILDYGPNKYSAITLSLYAQELSLQGDLKQAAQYSELALLLQERFNYREYSGRTQQIIASSINVWLQPYHQVLAQLNQAYHQCFEYGDKFYATRSLLQIASLMFSQGNDLHKISAEITKRLPAIRYQHSQQIYSPLGILHQAILNLQGKLDSPISLDSPDFNETILLDNYFSAKNRAYYHIYKTLVLCMHGNYAEAVIHGSNAEYYIEQIANTNAFVHYRLFYSLALVNHYYDVDTSTQQHYLRTIQEHIEYFRQIAQNNSENYQAVYSLLQAEYARITNQTTDMYAFYDQTIDYAHEHGQIYIEAMAYEQSAKLYLANDRQRLAKQYFSDAYACYLQWGAIVKINQLTNQYGHLLPSISESISSSINKSISPISRNSVDRDTFFQILNIFATPIPIEAMLEQVLPLLHQLAPAQSIHLLLEQHQGLQLIASSKNNKLINIPYLDKALPLGFLEQIYRSEAPLIIQNTIQDPNIQDMPYFRYKYIKSLICLPLTSQTRIIGLLYLENSNTINAFSTSQIASLKIIASQLANALEHASLSQNIDQISKELSSANHNLNTPQITDMYSLREQEINQADSFIADLSINIITLDQRTIVMPLKGEIDMLRINQAITTLNTNQRVRPAQILIVDISALPHINPNTATLLLHLIEATSQQLPSYIYGISEQQLEILASLDIDLGSLVLPPHLQEQLVQSS